MRWKPDTLALCSRCSRTVTVARIPRLFRTLGRMFQGEPLNLLDSRKKTFPFPTRSFLNLRPRLNGFTSVFDQPSGRDDQVKNTSVGKFWLRKISEQKICRRRSICLEHRWEYRRNERKWGNSIHSWMVWCGYPPIQCPWNQWTWNVPSTKVLLRLEWLYNFNYFLIGHKILVWYKQ